ncbi:MAG: antitoxin VapB family protein [Thermoplasmata archaeon]
MGVRTIAVTDDVYERLRAMKRPDESFSRLLDRLVGRPSLFDLAELITPEQAAAIERTVEEGRARSRARRARMIRS